jgi:SAM-dependent methyltransferase
MIGESVLSDRFPLKAAALGLGLLGVWAVLLVILKRSRNTLEACAEEQRDFADQLSQRWIPLAIVTSAGLSLFLELAVIRWQTTVFPLFSLYKNFGLLACFAGLGLGYALAGRKEIPLVFTIPLLFWQFLVLLGIRFGLGEIRLRSIMATPGAEQLNMSFSTTTNLWSVVAIYLLLGVAFLLTALAFVPVGQLCGRLMRRTKELPAYGFNLLGSLVGIILLLGMSYLWAPPSLWFLCCCLGLVIFQIRSKKALLIGATATLLSMVVLLWPLGSGQRLYSPYQVIEYTVNEQNLEIKAAGLFYQLGTDLSDDRVLNEVNPYFATMQRYYELPYEVSPNPESVLIVGSGTGNDLSAALRRGAGSVDAIDIDPAIMSLGERFHPEQPYSDPRVTNIVNDARTFLRSTPKTYDAIVYGFIDSYSLLSHSSSLRLDSFVYTVEGLRNARSRLKDGGLLCLSFAGLTDELDWKLFAMLTEAFGGHQPICLQTGGFPTTSFLIRKDGDGQVPAHLLEGEGKFIDLTASYEANSEGVDLSTDDWPFFYMPRRVYPTSYFGMFTLLGVLSLLLITSFFKGEGVEFSSFIYFFLGAGFMLIEAKGITELGLTFGNTWHVIGIVIAGILFMAFLANCVVQVLRPKSPWIPFALLLLSLALGYCVSKYFTLPPTPLGKLTAVIVLTSPMFFSGLVFSALIQSTKNIASIMAINILGAMVGGLLEYNSMYFGFQFLYLLAGLMYLLAMITFYLRCRTSPI